MKRYKITGKVNVIGGGVENPIFVNSVGSNNRRIVVEVYHDTFPRVWERLSFLDTHEVTVYMELKNGVPSYEPRLVNDKDDTLTGITRMSLDPFTTEVTAKMVKELRDRTGAGLFDCKYALRACKGNQELATEWIRLKGTSIFDNFLIRNGIEKI